MTNAYPLLLAEITDSVFAETTSMSQTTLFWAAILLVAVLLLSRVPPCARLVNWLFSFFLKRRSLFIRISTILVFLAGVFIYTIGYYYPYKEVGGQMQSFVEIPSQHNFYIASVILRACVSSLEMFVSHSDLLEVTEALHHDSGYMFTFILIHCLAILLSVGFILSFVFYRQRVKILMKNWGKTPDDVYIFWGMNAPSLRLAESIHVNRKKEKEEPQMIFITEDDHSTEKNHRLSFSHLLGSGHAGATYISTVEKQEGVVMAFDEKDTYKRLAKLAAKHKNLNFMFFSDDETFNLSRASKVMHDPLLAKHSQYIYTYCHARREVINMSLMGKTYLNSSTDYDEHFNLVDSSIYAVEGLKNDKEAQPVNFVDIQTTVINGKEYSTGIVTSAFNSMVIGFSETGQAALSFLYEYGAFLGPDGQRSEFNCVAIDRAMETIKGSYYAEKPAMRTHENVQLVTAEVGSERFWTLIEEHMQGLNYVVIALGNDKLNTTTAIDLYNFILRKNGGKMPQKFVIYVRLNKRNTKDIIDISSLYFNNQSQKNIIRFFGAEEDVFSERMVIKKQDIQQVKKFSNTYSDFYHNYKSKKDEEAKAQKAAAKEKQQDKKENPDMLVIARKKQRSFTQNLANAHHVKTKMALLNNNGKLSDDLIVSLSKMKRQPNIDQFDGTYWYDSPESYATQVMRNLAIVEHLRWNAAMEMLGYTYNKELKKCDERTMEHPCITSWENLLDKWKEAKEKEEASTGKEAETTKGKINKNDYEYLCFDYNVVETSIRIYLSEKKW